MCFNKIIISNIKKQKNWGEHDGSAGRADCH